MAGQPTDYLKRHVRFVSQPEDEISPHSARPAGTLGADNAALVVFGSRYPYWDQVDAKNAFNGWSREDRARCFAGNALDTYPRLAARVSAGVSA